VGSLRSREKKPDQAYRSRKEAAKVPNTAGIVGSLFSKEYSDRDKKREPWKDNKKEKTKKWIARYSTKREPPASSLSTKDRRLVSLGSQREANADLSLPFLTKEQIFMMRDRLKRSGER
jgi:hypothetical protein